MRRHWQYIPAKQIPLGLDLNANPGTESALRAAYLQLELSKRLSFEQVMSDRAYAIGVRNMAEAMARRAATGSAAKSKATSRDIAGCQQHSSRPMPSVDHPMRTKENSNVT